MIVLHRQDLLDRVGGDTELAEELLELFRDEALRLRSEIEEAVARGDSIALGEAAHGLKGSAGNVGALGVEQVAAELERAARVGELTGSAAACRRLSLAIDALLAELGERVA